MLADADVMAVVAVKDLDKAKKFYEETLGLKPAGNDPDGIVYKSGSGKILVYASQYAGTNQATGAAWTVKDIDAVVKDLKAKGVSFEKYDLPGATHEGDLHVMGDMKAAWFKDPDGNILAIDNGA